MTLPQVVNVRKAELRKRGYKDFADWAKNPKHLYVGRNMSFYVPGAAGSKWANPFPVKKHGREECIRLYEDRLRSSDELQRLLLEELRDVVELGCWCSPEACHADVLVKFLREQQTCAEGDEEAATTGSPSDEQHRQAGRPDEQTVEEEEVDQPQRKRSRK